MRREPDAASVECICKTQLDCAPIHIEANDDQVARGLVDLSEFQPLPDFPPDLGYRIYVCRHWSFAIDRCTLAP